MIWPLFVLIYALCGFLAWGVTLGALAHRFPYSRHVCVVTILAAAGPCGLIACLAMLEWRYWRLKPFTKEERWEIFKGNFDSLNRADFEKFCG